MALEAYIIPCKVNQVHNGPGMQSTNRSQSGFDAYEEREETVISGGGSEMEQDRERTSPDGR
jgi:hypothetical protein